MHIKNIFFIIGIIISISLVSSEIDTIYGLKDSCINIPQSCTNCSFVNITKIQLPDNTFVSLNNIMTKSGNDYNYSFCNTSSFGTYIIHTCGDIDGYSPCYSPPPYKLIINGMGSELTTSQGILYIVIIFGLLLIFTFTLIGAIAFPWKNNRNDDGYIIGINDFKYLKIALWVFVYLEVLFIVMIVKNLTGYLANEGTYSFFYMIYTFLLVGLIPFFPLLIFFTVVIWLSDKKVLKKITMGLPMR